MEISLIKFITFQPIKNVFALHNRLMARVIDYGRYYNELEHLMICHQTGHRRPLWLGLELALMVSRFLVTLAYSLPDWGADTRLLFFDTVTLLGANEFFNYMMLSILATAIYFHWMFYPYSVNQAYQAIAMVAPYLRQAEQAFKTRDKSSRRAKANGQVGDSFENRLVRFLGFSRWLNVVGFLSSEVTILPLYRNATPKMAEYLSSGWQGWLKFTFLQMNGLHYLFVMYMLHVACTITFFNIVLFTMIAFHRLAMCQQLQLQSKGRFNVIRLRNFMTDHNAVVQDILGANRIYSRSLLLLFVVNYPLNAYLVMLFLKGAPMSPTVIIQTVSYLWYQFYFIFAIHIMAIAYSKRIHRFTKPMIYLYVHQIDRLQILARFKMAVYIEKFHTKKRFGLTYGPVGLISLMAFFKFTFIYVRFLFYSYKQH